MEEKQKGEQFKVLEPADLPTRPSKPNRPKVLGLALLASMVIGAGGAFALEMLDPTLRGSGEFKNFFDMPILACLPVIQNDRLKRQIAVRRAAVVGGLVSILGAYLVFLVVHGQKVQSILQAIGDPSDYPSEVEIEDIFPPPAKRIRSSHRDDRSISNLKRIDPYYYEM